MVKSVDAVSISVDVVDGELNFFGVFQGGGNENVPQVPVPTVGYCEFRNFHCASVFLMKLFEPFIIICITLYTVVIVCNADAAS